MAELLVRGLARGSITKWIWRVTAGLRWHFQQRRFDVILLDVMLPGMNGLEVAKQLRLRREQVPVLMLTARDALPDIVKGLGRWRGRLHDQAVFVSWNSWRECARWDGGGQRSREMCWKWKTWCWTPRRTARFAVAGRFIFR